MNSADKQHYLKLCQHPKIQALQPETENNDGCWIPTEEQLHELLKEKLPYPDRSVLLETEEGWEYDTYFREWAADYGTYIDAHRQFVGPNVETVLLRVLIALIGTDERWMV